MEIIRPTTLFLEYVAGILSGNFTLVDIGCSGGINPTWRTWGSHLRAFGFDPNLAEIERLSAAEILAGGEIHRCFYRSTTGRPFHSTDAQRNVLGAQSLVTTQRRTYPRDSRKGNFEGD